MMTIDPTKDIVTEEEYSRPVMLLYALGNDTPYGFVVFNITKTATDEFWMMTDENRPALRNVAPPEPEPVLREAWVWWNSHGKATVSLNEEWCVHQRTVERGVYARAAVMSDGSPVPGEEDLATKQIAEFAERYQDDVNHWKAKAEALQAEVDRVRKAYTADMKRMTPVVDAAVIWERHFSHQAAERLVVAVRTYQQTPKKIAEQAVANVAEMMGPVKSCATCKFSCNLEVTIGCIGNDFIEWEPRHD
jgi:hypothetical protein